ncbi:MAG: alpha/beta fold hydrolase [Thermodesulfobacteriota bacterium]|nr:alpha/beta fold hydrolase [Thermodesulfobacteriota bacterium]
MMIEDFRGTLEERMKRLIGLVSHYRSLIIVGSSYGGLMAAVFACQFPIKVRRLILLAPALTFLEFRPYLGCAVKPPVFVYHGKHDEVVPVEPVHDIAERVFSNLVFHVVDDDHVLSRTFQSMDWEGLLEMGTARLPVAEAL